MERPPKTLGEKKETTEIKHYVEDVVVHAQEIRNVCLRDPNSPLCRPEILHTEIEHSDVGVMFENYNEHKILSLDDIRYSIENVAVHLEHELSKLDSESEEYLFAHDKYQLIRKRAEEIRTGVQRYVRTLSQFFQLKKQQFRLEPEDFRDKLQQIDKQRRFGHDALIGTLSIYSEVVNSLKEYGFLEEHTVISWDHVTKLSDIEENNKNIIIFSPKILENRDLVKDWAISAHLYEQLKHIEQLKENSTTRSGA